MPKTESVGELDDQLINRALKAFKDFYGNEIARIPAHLYDECVKRNYDMKGYERGTCLQLAKGGNGKLVQKRTGLGAQAKIIGQENIQKELTIMQ